MNSRPSPASNHCTLFPEGPWSKCCAEHDRLYTTKEAPRAEADRRLRECLKKHLPAPVAWSMWAGVRLFGWYFWNKKS